jgi:beta-glucosidase-like glycosyl hydrolase
MVTRLDGHEIKKRFSYYRSLVRKGVAGFIVFGGELGTVRTYVQKLQDETEAPLIIASDLERGLGQQLKGGTHFPPAMALAATLKKGRTFDAQGSGARRVRASFMALACEGRFAGINTIFAPVLDINTNPKNPIIAARAFGAEPGIVSFLGAEMIRVLQKNGIAACGKHFPGHGDTSIDSHIQLPVLKQDLKRLRRCELKPFMAAVNAGVRMIMLGHLSVPALDPSGMPVSVSEKAVEFIRREMGYDGILITDALNMGGIGKFSEHEASRLALAAGIDILLHPSDPDRMAAYLAKMHVPFVPDRLLRFRSGLRPAADRAIPPFDQHRELSRRLTEAAISVTGRCRIRRGEPLVIVLNDEDEEKGEIFIRSMEKYFPGTRAVRVRPGSSVPKISKGPDASVIVAIFSETRAWKGGASGWLQKQAAKCRKDADLYISFGSPYLLDYLGKVPRACAFWDADEAQAALPKVLRRVCTGR